MKNTSKDQLPLGTTPPFASMHRWLQRGLIVCLTVLVLEGSFAVPLLALWYGWPTLSLLEICSEFEKLRWNDESRECIFPYPLFTDSEGAGQTTAQDDWGVQPRPRYRAVGYREFVELRDARRAREAAASSTEQATPPGS